MQQLTMMTVVYLHHVKCNLTGMNTHPLVWDKSANNYRLSLSNNIYNDSMRKMCCKIQKLANVLVNDLLRSCYINARLQRNITYSKWNVGKTYRTDKIFSINLFYGANDNPRGHSNHVFSLSLPCASTKSRRRISFWRFPNG